MFGGSFITNLVRSSAAKKILFATLAAVGTAVLYEVGVIGPIRKLGSWIYSKYTRSMTTELHVKPVDNIYDAVLTWIQEQTIRCRNSIIFPNLDENTRSCDFIPNEPIRAVFANPSGANPVTVDIYPDTTNYNSNNIRIPFRLLFWSSDPNLRQNFINNCDQNYRNRDGFNIYTWSCDRGWIKLSRKSKRSVASVFMSSQDKNELIEDIERFRREKDRHDKMNQPYRRSYLFYGPGGCGKTSMIHALASTYQYDIYIFNLSDPKLTDTIVLEAINDVRAGAIIVYEDIDFIITRIQSETPDTRMPLTMSGIYNALDGVALSSNSISILTTNRPDALPPNMKRPGRVDVVIKFDYLTEETFSMIMKRNFRSITDDKIIEIVNEILDTFDVKTLAAVHLTPAVIINIIMKCPEENLQAFESKFTEFLTRKAINDDSTSTSQEFSEFD